jgi:hypothetical protein
MSTCLRRRQFMRRGSGLAARGARAATQMRRRAHGPRCGRSNFANISTTFVQGVDRRGQKLAPRIALERRRLSLAWRGLLAGLFTLDVLLGSRTGNLVPLQRATRTISTCLRSAGARSAGDPRLKADRVWATPRLIAPLITTVTAYPPNSRQKQAGLS